MIDLTGYRLVINKDNIVTECVPPKAAVTYEVMGQRDPRWARQLLGNSKVSTIGGYGCLVTCQAILAACAPNAMNDALRAAGGFQAEPRGGYMAYAGFTTAFEAAAKRCGPRSIRFQHMSAKMMYGQKRPFGWMETLMDWLAGGNPAIIEVDMDVKTTTQQQHFVVGLPNPQDESVEIIDPWDKSGDEYGRRQFLLPEYGTSTENAVWRYILYEVN